MGMGSGTAGDGARYTGANSGSLVSVRELAER